ncbi:MAG TPA: terminase family protein [Allosphingosinicella sp.]|nr:terminase family protein [Allosphingosinicella sp.]
MTAAPSGAARGAAALQVRARGRKPSEIVALLATLRQLPPETRRLILTGFPERVVDALREEWWWQARGGQIEPKGDWRVWAIVAGRGFGKTRAGAEWVSQRAREDPRARIALVGASRDEVGRVMVEGESGILAAARTGEAPRWIASRGLLLFPSGARAYAYSAAQPAQLRGPQHHFAWCDELAKWPRAAAAWDNLMLGLRLGEAPRTIVTTTPQPVPVLKRILALDRCILTRGRTDDNPDCAADFRTAMRMTYGGTRLGRQELDGELLDDLPGALWTRDMLEASRGCPLRRESYQRVVVGVDPPATAQGGCGIVVCGIGRGGTADVLADLSVTGLRPEGWARRVAAAFEAWDAQLVAAEKNQGGEMVEAVLRVADANLPVRLVCAVPGKAARAEPIALRFETGQARLAGAFPELEDELCAMTYGGYEGDGRSPDRADAMVWAMTELFTPPRAEPRIRRL